MRTLPSPLCHEAAVKRLVASLHEQCVVTASDDRTVIVWDAERDMVSQECLAHPRGVCALALSPDCRRLVSASDGETLTVWDVRDGHTQTAIACTWSPDGTLAALQSTDNTMRVWDAQTFEQRDMLDDPGCYASEHIPFSPD